MKAAGDRKTVNACEFKAIGHKLEPSVPQPLFHSGYIKLSYGHSGQWNTFAVSPDGQRFIIPTSRIQSRAWAYEHTDHRRTQLDGRSKKLIRRHAAY